MKMIVAILQPHRLDTVREALASVGVHGMTASEAQGYGRPVEVRFIDYIRAEQTFDTPQALQEQIARDVERARAVLE